MPMPGTLGATLVVAHACARRAPAIAMASRVAPAPTLSPPAGRAGAHAIAPAGRAGTHAIAPAGRAGAHAIAPAGRAGAHAIAPAGRAGAHAVSRWPRSGRYGTPQGRGTPPRTKGTKPCWIRDGRPRGSPLRGPRRRVVRPRLRRPRLSSPTLVVAHAIAPAGRAGAHAVSRWPRSGRHGTPQGRGTPPRTKGTKPCWIRDGRPRGSPLRGPRRRAVRVGATLVVAHACRRPRYRARRARRRPCRFPDGLVRVGTGRRKGVGRHLARRERSRAGFGMGDREGRPYAGLVAELFA